MEGEVHAGNERANLTRSPQKPRIRPSVGNFLHHLAAFRPYGRIRDAYNFNMLKMERFISRSANEKRRGIADAHTSVYIYDILYLFAFKSLDDIDYFNLI